MPLYIDKKIVANSANAKAQHQAMVNTRAHWKRVEEAFAATAGPQYNNAARLPQDTFREFDRTIKRVMVGDEGQNIVSMLPQRSLPVGKIVAEYARASDSGKGKASISGRGAHMLDKASYDYDGALVLIHDDAFGRPWREVEAMRSEDFDALQDDQANSTRAVSRSIADHVMLGVPDQEFKGKTAPGMKNSPNTQALNLGVGGINKDLTDPTATYDDFEAVVIAILTALQGKTNNVMSDIQFGVSSQIWFNALRRESGNYDAGTIMERLQRIPGVAGFVRTSGDQLDGNEILAWANAEQYIQIQSGMAVNTQPVIRTQFNDDFNFVTWGAAGLLIKADKVGRSGILYARNIS